MHVAKTRDKKMCRLLSLYKVKVLESAKPMVTNTILNAEYE